MGRARYTEFRTLPPVLPDLLGQIPADEDIGSVTADGAYDTRKCREAIVVLNGYSAPGIPVTVAAE